MRIPVSLESDMQLALLQLHLPLLLQLGGVPLVARKVIGEELLVVGRHVDFLLSVLVLDRVAPPVHVRVASLLVVDLVVPDGALLPTALAFPRDDVKKLLVDGPLNAGRVDVVLLRVVVQRVLHLDPFYDRAPLTAVIRQCLRIQALLGVVGVICLLSRASVLLVLVCGVPTSVVVRHAVGSDSGSVDFSNARYRG